MDEPKIENVINLNSSVSEQIADMQLMYLRQVAMNRTLTLDEIRTLEILSKVKNVEVEKRQVPTEDPKKVKARELQALANATQLNLIDSPKEVEDEDKKATSVSKS